MANQGQQGNQRQEGNPGQGDRDRDREGNLGQSGDDLNRPTGTSGQEPNRAKPGSQSDRGTQQNRDEEDSGIGNRNTNR